MSVAVARLESMVSALYRRYRPEAFAELVGQQHVTEPLMTALRTDRVNHAYLFSGPRGCGKTTSARILARCLNCAEGPTDSPCNVCPSCVELGRDGGGSIDVIEIDAASHGGVDDARDLRERATISPARDRYKVYIIDEAHMVSKDGFNALLKIVEEPPEHVKFIFATTEPDKVIGTIRSRTHHYPFRLIAPSVLLDYVTKIVNEEGVSVDPGVLPLVIRAGGGSARDTLSLLDQLIAGSEGPVSYELAVSLLGFTHAELLDEVTKALAAGDASAAFASVERVVETGQDPRRFVEDLLEYLRDLIIAAVSDNAEALLHGAQEEQVERMRDRAHEFGPGPLSRAADIVAKSLTGMTGATSPKLHLELMLARLLVGGQPAPVSTAPAGPSRQPASSQPVGQRPAPASTPEPQKQESAPQQTRPTPEPTPEEPARPNVQAATNSFRVASAAAPPERPEPTPDPAHEPEAAESKPAEPAPTEPEPTEPEPTVPEPEPTEPEPNEPEPTEPEPQQSSLTFKQIEDAWPEVLSVIESKSRRAWMVASAIKPVDFDGDAVGLAFRSQPDMEEFRQGKDGEVMIWHIIRGALQERFRRAFKFAPRDTGYASDMKPSVAPAPEPAADETTRAQPEPTPEPGQPIAEERPTSVPAAGGWAVAEIPSADEVQVESPYSTADPWAEPDPPMQGAEPPQQQPANQAAQQHEPQERELTRDEENRYGEAVIREELGAEFIEEITNEGGR
ncbi:DNA polymerase III subunits gamma and tau [Agrococcus casei LMG 22410]|uniref:DNA polymerase III subunit gamma/tau n=3 Tax=Agrococcus TaxID=46352 RepID=A0A1R4GFY3_9MICO|nr:DNA polymerase III subunits gamma and tau [Agrococcus casei LMG 22410]